MTNLKVEDYENLNGKINEPSPPPFYIYCCEEAL